MNVISFLEIIILTQYQNVSPAKTNQDESFHSEYFHFLKIKEIKW